MASRRGWFGFISRVKEAPKTRWEELWIEAAIVWGVPLYHAKLRAIGGNAPQNTLSSLTWTTDS
jgi:hypothetical protein